MPTHIIQLTLDAYQEDTEVVIAVPAGRQGEIGGNLTLVIPGNPGVAIFYRDFAQILADELTQTVAVISHLGHGTHPVPLSGVLSLPVLTWQQQVQHKVAAAAALVSLFRSTSVSLVGHSIGAMIVAHLAASSRLSVPVDKCLLLFPTFLQLHAGLAPPVRLAILPLVRLLLAFLLHLLPGPLRNAALASAESMSDEARYHSANRISAHFVHSVLYMAATEAADILDEFDEPTTAFFNQRTPANVRFIYGPTDSYTPPPIVRRVVTDFPHLAQAVTHAPREVKHAFVLAHSEQVAKLAVSFLGDNTQED